MDGLTRVPGTAQNRRAIEQCDLTCWFRCNFEAAIELRSPTCYKVEPTDAGGAWATTASGSIKMTGMPNWSTKSRERIQSLGRGAT
jgi:hypothetical protein